MSIKPNPTAQSTTQHITPSQRAAVVIAMLGESAAKPIVERLDDAAIARIANSLEEISFLAREQLIEIVIDFLRHLRQAKGSLRGGAGSARKILEGVLDEPRLKLVLGGKSPNHSDTKPAANLDSIESIWEEFAQREPVKIAAYLAGLTPNIVALILRNLSTTLCSELICLLDEDVQTSVLGEMVDPPPPSPEIDGVIARMVKMEFLQAAEVAEENDDSQLGTIGEMLSLIPGARRQSLVGYLQGSHAEKLGIIQRGMFEVGDLPQLLHRNQIPILFKTLEQDFLLQVLACFQKKYGEVAEYFLSNISNRMADQMRDELTRIKPPNDAAADQIEKEFLTRLMTLKRDGVIIVERVEAEPEAAS